MTAAVSLKQTRCRCELASYVIDGERVEGVARLDPDCPTHGLGEEWPAGHHLSCHARMVKKRRQRTIGSGANKFTTRWTEERLETPREVEARLLGETASSLLTEPRNERSTA